MRAGYAPLPTQQPSPEADRELDEAFASDDDDIELTATARPSSKTTTPAYDFERDFDYVRPPPGSPPHPSAVALPNDFGNSNGLLPSSPIATPPPHRPSFFRRAVAVILPTHYTRLPTTGAIVGGGTQNDGVFANVTAKPSRSVRVRTEDGIYVVPEDTQSNAPPSYAAAQADAVPPYWDTTIHAPAGPDSDAGMIIEDLPSGSIFVFIANLFTSFFFQFVGFLLTYLLHSTHAAKFGSRAGLGLTLIQYGFYSRIGDGNGFIGTGMIQMPGDDNTDVIEGNTGSSTDNMPISTTLLSITSKEWLSFLLMTLGWFILLSSLVGFWRVKHWEASIRASQARAPSTDRTERDITPHRTLENIFRLSGLSNERVEVHNPSQLELEEARLQRDLRSAGLL